MSHPISEALTLRVDKEDKLPDKVCDSCAASISYINEFKQIAIKAQETYRQLSSRRALVLPGGSVFAIKAEYPVLETFAELKRRALANIENFARQYEGHETKELAVAKQELKQKVTEPPKHHKERPRSRNYICDVCGKACYTAAQLKVHTNVHNGQRPFKCLRPDCDASFTFEWALRNHHKIHLETRDFCCHLCGKTYKRKFQIEVHMTYHTDPKLPCPFCGKMLRHRDVLNRHVMQVHENRRNHACNQCEKKFGNAHNLKIHLRAHRKEKIFECEQCTINFAYKSSLTAHNQKVHGIVLPKNANRVQNKMQ